MKPEEVLEAMCERCHKNIQSIPSKGYLPHRECPFRHISGDYCEEYDTLKKALGEKHDKERTDGQIGSPRR